MPNSSSQDSRRCWLTFPTRTQVEQPIIWQMSRRYPEVSFDIRQASVQNEIGIMAVLFQGPRTQVSEALQFLRDHGVTVEPIEKSVVDEMAYDPSKGAAMPTLFPGMDPYLEDPSYWPDFHGTFVPNLRNEILAELPPKYDARVNERVYLIHPEENREVIPDVSMSWNDQSTRAASAPSTSNAAILEPMSIPLLVHDVIREPYIEVRLRDGREVITIIELLSPSNKTGVGRLEYLDKRDAIIRGDAHLVELDLLLGGRRLPMGKPLPPGDYYAFVSRAQARPDCDVYAWPLPRPLPSLPIPLRPDDPDIIVNFAKVFADTYRHGQYAGVLRYDQSPPVPPNSPQTADWVRQTAAHSIQPAPERKEYP